MVLTAYCALSPAMSSISGKLFSYRNGAWDGRSRTGQTDKRLKMREQIGFVLQIGLGNVLLLLVLQGDAS
jgi:hypothetical protein